MWKRIDKCVREDEKCSLPDVPPLPTEQSMSARRQGRRPNSLSQGKRAPYACLSY